MTLHNKLENQYLLDIDLILYREGKTHGKNVKFVTKINDSIQVIYVEVMGIVSEDKFYLSPVKADYDDILYTEVHS